MNIINRSLLTVVSITLAVSFGSQTSAAVGTNIVGNGSAVRNGSATTNGLAVSQVTTNSTWVTPSLNDTNMVSDVHHYFTKSFIEDMIQQEDENFFGVHWMDFIMGKVKFESIITQGGGTFGIDTAMIPTVRVSKDLYFGPFYNAKYPMSSVGPTKDVTDIGFMLRLDL